MKNTFSEKELNQLAELRKLVGELLEDGFEQTDDFLITWIRYANHDIKKAEQALRSNKIWRQENNLDRILLEDMKDLHEACPVELNPGFDKFGCPIMALRINWDIKQCVHASPDGRDRMVRYFMKHCEHTINIVRKQYYKNEGRVTRFSAVIDLEGFNYRQLMSTRVISALTGVAKTAEDNYPGTAKTLYMVNIPKTFKILFNIIKPFLSGDTISRIKLFDSDKSKWREALLEDIAEDQLPSFI